jgi:hypothetical protein
VNLEAWQTGDSVADLRLGGRVNLGLAIVKQGDGPIRQVEAVRSGDCEAPFLPEAGRDGDGATLSRMSFDCRLGGAITSMVMIRASWP